MSKLATWLHEEPVRVYLYSVAVAVVALLLALGIVSGSLVPVILSVVSALLAVPGTESLRSRVSPVKGVDEGA